MAVWTEIRLSGLAGGKRLDAEYYQPSYLRLVRELDRLRPVRLGDVTFVTDGIHASPDIVEDDGVRYLSAKCVKDNEFNLATTLCISKGQHEANKRTSLREGDVLLTTVGTIGNAAVVQRDVIPSNIDRHLGLIRLPAQSTLDPYYLSAFLNSTYGRFQTVREATGNVQLNLFIEKIKELKVPLLDCAETISKKVQEAYAKRKESLDLYGKAAELFLLEIGLKQLNLSPTLYYERSFAEVQETGRIDAQFFQPHYRHALKALLATKPKHIAPLGQFLAFLTNGHTPKHHDLSIGDISFLTAEHVFDFRIDYDSDKRILHEHHDGELKRTRLKKGDCLITIKGRIGNAAIVEELSKPVNINQDVALCRVKDELPSYYLTAYLNSLAGHAFTQQFCTGQINPFLSLGNVRLIPIPIYDDKRMQRIAALAEDTIGKAQASHNHSRLLLDQAKQIIDGAVLQRSRQDGSPESAEVAVTR